MPRIAREHFKEQTPGRKHSSKKSLSSADPVNNKEKESQVLWEDPQETEERNKLVVNINKGEDNLPAVAETEQETSTMEMETMGSIDMENLTANMLENEKENLG